MGENADVLSNAMAVSDVGYQNVIASYRLGCLVLQKGQKNPQDITQISRRYQAVSYPIMTLVNGHWTHSFALYQTLQQGNHLNRRLAGRSEEKWQKKWAAFHGQKR